MQPDLKDGKLWDGHEPRVTGTVAVSRPLPYVHPMVLTPRSTKGYFLLVVDIGDGLFVEWMYNRN